VEEFVLDLTNGNVAEVKVILASAIAALAIYQLALAAVGYGKVRIPFLANPAALRAHRAIGDTIFALAIITGVMCLSVYGFEDDGGIHAIAGAVVLGVLAVKTCIVRSDSLKIGRLLPPLGIAVFVLFMVTWASSAGDFLIEGP
jgi:Na+-translocating ferredoxin:NAD+ oxidoreductase RnfD subunit